MEPKRRIELLTLALRKRCSTAELLGLNFRTGRSLTVHSSCVKHVFPSEIMSCYCANFACVALLSDAIFGREHATSKVLTRHFLTAISISHQHFTF